MAHKLKMFIVWPLIEKCANPWCFTRKLTQMPNSCNLHLVIVWLHLNLFNLYPIDN